MSEWVLKVTVDTNDGDYITEEVKLKSIDDLEKFIPLIELIKSKHGEFPFGEQGDAYNEIYKDLGVDENIFDEFCETYLPYPVYGFHTIEGINLIHRKIYSDNRLV